MRTLQYSLIAYLALCCLTHASEELVAVRPLTAKPSEGWKLRWDRSDDFKGEKVDWRKWNKNPEKFPAWSWDNAKNISVSNGFLSITLRAESDGDYTSGILKSFSKGTYGYYESRIKAAPAFPGVCPAFWIYSPIDDKVVEKGKVRYSEIDIVELTQRQAFMESNVKIMDHNLHVILSNGEKGVLGRSWQRPHNPKFKEAQATEYQAPFDPRDAYHIYGCLVEKHQIIWYVDGVEVGRKPNKHWHRPMSIALSLGLRAPYAIFENNRLVVKKTTSSNALPTTMLVDYVRFWERDDTIK